MPAQHRCSHHFAKDPHRHLNPVATLLLIIVAALRHCYGLLHVDNGEKEMNIKSDESAVAQ